MGSIDHENGEFVLYRGVIGLFHIGAVHVEGLLGAEERGIVANGFLKVSIVKVRWCWGWLRVRDVKEVDVRDGTTVWGYPTRDAAV